MRKTLSILFLLAVALCGQASAQLSQCAITATIYDNNGDLLSGARIVVVKVVKNGSLISNSPLVYTTNASGVATFNLPRSSVAWIWANSYGLNANGSAGVAVTVPAAASANLEELAAFSSVLTTLGDLAYGGASGVFTRLAGNVSSTAKFLCQQGNGTTSTAPGWCAFAGSGNLTLTYDNDARTATFGYVPSSSELLAAFGSQSANTILAGPATGSAATAGFRALAAADIPTITNAKLENSAVTIGSTSISLGATAATIAGLTLTTPTIASFNNANHSHTDSISGGQLTTDALTGLGTGVATALGVNAGSAGAFVVNGGALGTPASGVGTNLTALNASNLASGIVAAARGGAGTSNGILKANGGGVVSAAVAGTDYETAFAGNLKYRVAAGVIRPEASGGSGSTITWTFLDGGTAHGSVFFTSVTTDGSGRIVIGYPTVAKVVSFTITPDETLAALGVTAGCSVDLTSALCTVYSTVGLRGGYLTWSGSAWTKSSNITTWDVTGNASFSFNLPDHASRINYEGVSAEYVGANPWYLERLFAGLGSYNAGFRLREMATGNLVNTASLTTSDRIVLKAVSPPQYTQIAANVVWSNLIQQQFFSSNSNFWIIAVFEMP